MRHARTVRCAAALAAVLSLQALPLQAFAQGAKPGQTDEARSRFQRGVELFRDADYRAALIEFKRAYEIAPNYKVLYNLGQTSLELQDYAAALRAFEGYLQGGGKELKADRRAQVEAEIAKLRTRVAKVTIEVNVEGAEITVDDVVVGKSPLAEPVLVSAGRRKIAASKSGQTPASRVLDVAGGDATKLSLELTEPQTTVVQVPTSGGGDTTTTTTNTPTGPVTTTVTNASPAKNMTPVWIGLGATGVLAAGAVVFGVLAVGAKSDYDTKVGTLGVTSQSVDDARSKTKTFAAVTDVLGGAAIVAAGVTLVLALTRSASPKENASARLPVDVLVGPTGVGVAGAF